MLSPPKSAAEQHQKKNRIKIVLQGNLIKALQTSGTNFFSQFFSFLGLAGMARLETNFNKNSKFFIFGVFLFFCFCFLEQFLKVFKSFTSQLVDPSYCQSIWRSKLQIANAEIVIFSIFLVHFGSKKLSQWIPKMM
jgi:hypothetical protein